MKYNKRLTVRISNPRFWYSKHLNETFDVLKTPDEDDYVLTEDYIKGEDATKRLIKKCDCIETESPSDSEAVEWVNVRDNSDGFRKFLDNKKIEWQPNETGTLVPAGTDLYWIGRQAEQAKQREACVNDKPAPYNPIP